MTFSRYMQRLFNTEPTVYEDKLRATDNADEIVRAAQNWVNEALLHPRKDDIIDFARGEVLMRIGSSDYSAQVIVGNRGKKGLLLYDIINLSESTIHEKQKMRAHSIPLTPKMSLAVGVVRPLNPVYPKPAQMSTEVSPSRAARTRRSWRSCGGRTSG